MNNNSLIEKVRVACEHPDASQWQAKMTIAERKVEAIRQLRFQTGYSLKDAKDVAEYWYFNRNSLNFPHKTVSVDAAGGKRVEVTDNADGTFVVTVVTAYRCNNMGDLTRTLLELGKSL